MNKRFEEATAVIAFVFFACSYFLSPRFAPYRVLLLGGRNQASG